MLFPQRVLSGRLGQRVNPIRETFTCPTHGEGIGFDGFGLHAVEFEAFEMSLIVFLEIFWKMCFHCDTTS